MRSTRASAVPRRLASARAALAGRGIGLILDYVPNHVAPDHPWAIEHPDYFIGGTAADREADPEAFVETAAGVLANGKDPYFAPWPDVIQLNAFSPGLRQAVVDTLVSIAEQCDGVRCDMAMLMTNEVFARTWGARRARAGGRLLADLIPAVRASRPDLAVHGRGVLGHGMDPAAAGLRPLLRQASLRPPGGRVRAVCAGPPPGRGRLPGAARALHRESRRATRRGRVHSREGARGGGRDVHLEGARLYHEVSSTVSTPTFRCSSGGGRRSQKIISFGPSTTSCWPRSPTQICETATGSCATAQGGRTTAAPINCWPGAGARTGPGTSWL